MRNTSEAVLSHNTPLGHHTLNISTASEVFLMLISSGQMRLKSHEIDSLMKLIFSKPNRLFTCHSLYLNMYYMHSCESQSPLLNFLYHIQFPHCQGHFPHRYIADIPTVQTHSPQPLFWDICNQLQSFDIQSCCMMSTYHITKYNQSIRNIFKIMQKCVTYCCGQGSKWVHFVGFDQTCAPGYTSMILHAQCLHVTP